MTILVVEDDPDQLALRCLLFRQSGFHVLAAACCLSALKAAKAGKPDCAVLDLRLPGEEEGLLLIRNLRDLHPSLPIFVLSGITASRALSMPELALAEAIFPKGTSIAPLLERLKALRAQRQEV